MIPSEKRVDWVRAKRMVAFLAIALVALLAFGKIFSAIVVPVAISGFLCFLLLPLVDRLDRPGLPRGVIVSCLLLLTLAVVGLIFLTVLPALYAETLEIVKLAPTVFTFVNQHWVEPFKEYLITLNVIDETNFDKILAEFSGVEKIPQRLQNALTTIWNTAPQFLSVVINGVLIPAITFILLRDYHKIVSRLQVLVPSDLKASFDSVMDRIAQTLNSVIKGQVIVAMIVTVLYVTGLTLAGLQASVTIGLVAGVCRVVPYMDLVVGGSLTLLAVLSNFQSFGHFFLVGGVFMAVQTIDGMLITPRVVGDRVGLHPIVVILSIISFGEIMGFSGVLLAIPIIAVAKVILQSLEPFYLAASHSFLVPRRRVFRRRGHAKPADKL